MTHSVWGVKLVVYDCPRIWYSIYIRLCSFVRLQETSRVWDLHRQPASTHFWATIGKCAAIQVSHHPGNWATARELATIQESEPQNREVFDGDAQEEPPSSHVFWHLILSHVDTSPLHYVPRSNGQVAESNSMLRVIDAQKKRTLGPVNRNTRNSMVNNIS